MDLAFAKIFKENEGKEDYDYTKRITWTSHSSFETPDIATILSIRMDTVGIEHQLAEKRIHASSFNIFFIPTSYGCDLNVDIYADDKNSTLFLRLWALTLRMKKRIVWGGRYKKEFEDLADRLELKKEKQESEITQKEEQETAKPQEEKQIIIMTQDGDTKKQQEKEDLEKWESYKKLPNNVSFTKREMARLWCEFKTAKEISEFTNQPEMDYYKPDSVHNEISKLRRTYKVYGIFIPTDEERKEKLMRLSIGSLK